MKIAITGNIGSGKSTFSRFAEELGFPVLKADDISKDQLYNDPKVKALVVKEFGSKAFNNDQPDKKFLAEIVFSNPEKLNKLEQILHPRVNKVLQQEIKNLSKKHPVVFVEAALIYESDMENMFDYVVLVTSAKENRLKRKILTGISEDDFDRRELNQIAEDEKKKRADFIFSNDSSIEALKMKFNLLVLTLGLSENK